MIGTAGWAAEKVTGGVKLERTCFGMKESIITNDWNIASEFLTQDLPGVFCVVWDLVKFSEAIFGLLSQATRDELAKTQKMFVGDTKIFHTDRLLGITLTKSLQGNFVKRTENNFYQIMDWVSGDTDQPTDADEVANLGDSILQSLESIGIYPGKLTSPIGAFMSQVDTGVLPTVYSNEQLIDASNYCLKMSGYEWRSAYKLGFFDKAYVYDLKSAYPSLMTGLPDTNKCSIIHSPKWISNADWGILKGIITINADISPLVYELDGLINPKGSWQGYFTTEETNWLINNHLGSFKLEDGYFFKWLSPDKLYKPIVEQLVRARQSDNALTAYVSKRIAQGISGKLDQVNLDETYGELFNPVLAAMTRSRCRLAVANFIYDNELTNNLVAVMVDGIVSTKEANRVGESWRLDAIGDCLTLGKGEIWRKGKKPLAISYDDVLQAFKSHPAQSYYEFGNKYIDLQAMGLDTDRVYEGFPRTGGQALDKVFNSKAIEIDHKGGQE